MSSARCGAWAGCAYDTAREFGGQVLRGQAGVPVVAWHRPPGAARQVAHQYTVFNAQQCRGLPEWEPERPSHSRIPEGRARLILRNSGASIGESPDGGARYDPRADRIELPPERAFGDPEAYLRTALHELGHWTGHADRLDRESLRRGADEGRGSDAWAREELRAEIASMMAGNDLELGHDPARHAVYGDAWIRLLKEEPTEIERASCEGQDICDSVLRMQRERPEWPGGREPGGGPARDFPQERSR